MALAIFRIRALRSRSPMPLFLSRRLLFSSSSALFHRPLSLTRFVIPSAAARFIPVRCQVSDSTPLGGGSECSDCPPLPPIIAKDFPGCDFKHWFIVVDKPGGEGATKEQIVGCYIKTLAKVLGSEEEAKKKIYSVFFGEFFAFGCEIDKETSDKLEALPGVLFVLADHYVDAGSKYYGGDRFVNGEIVKTSPEGD